MRQRSTFTRIMGREDGMKHITVAHLMACTCIAVCGAGSLMLTDDETSDKNRRMSSAVYKAQI